MSPKSRLYTLVKAWKNKPFQEVRDVCGQPWLGLSGEALEEHQSWSQRQAISNEPIFNKQGSKLTSSLFRPLLTATDKQLLRLFMEGLDTITYWYRSGRFIPGILPYACATPSIQQLHRCFKRPASELSIACWSRQLGSAQTPGC